MSKFFSILKRYRIFLLFVAINVVILFIAPEIGQKSVELTKHNLMEIFIIIPPIFVLLGLLDAWVKRETMMKYMGDESGIKGIIIAFIIGSATVGPLYVAFPIVVTLIKKGVSFFNVFIFIGACSTTKIPMLLFEAGNLGWNFMLLRLCCNITGIILIAFILEKTMTAEDRELMHTKSKLL